MKSSFFPVLRIYISDVTYVIWTAMPFEQTITWLNIYINNKLDVSLCHLLALNPLKINLYSFKSSYMPIYTHLLYNFLI